jgi:hypothetical protein
MLLLTSTSDLLRVITSSAATVKVHSSYVDLNGTTVTPGRTNTAISSATTTTIVGSPASSTSRNVKGVLIFNDDASLACQVTILHTDGTTAVDVATYNLAPQQGVQYSEGNGWTLTGVAVPTYPDVQVFNGVGGTWTKPTSFTPKVVIVEIIGAGGDAQREFIQEVNDDNRCIVLLERRESGDYVVLGSQVVPVTVKFKGDLGMKAGDKNRIDVEIDDTSGVLFRTFPKELALSIEE